VSGSLADDARHLQRARELAPADPELRFGCGVLEFHAGRYGIAFADWKSSLAQSPRHLGQIVLLSRDRLTTEGLITTVIPDSPAVLVRLAQNHFRGEHQASDRLVIAQRAERLLEESNMVQPQLDELLGSIYTLQSRYDLAVVAYQRALLLQSDNVPMRYRFARLLEEAGRPGEARRQAELCIQLDPSNQQCQNLLQSLTRANGPYTAR
jgi:tetratricopeptide (TPR) repeat protein